MPRLQRLRTSQSLSFALRDGQVTHTCCRRQSLYWKMPIGVYEYAPFTGVFTYKNPMKTRGTHKWKKDQSTCQGQMQSFHLISDLTNKVNKYKQKVSSSSVCCADERLASLRFWRVNIFKILLSSICQFDLSLYPIPCHVPHTNHICAGKPTMTEEAGLECGV